MPAVRPVIAADVAGFGPGTTTRAPPGLAVTVYWLITPAPVLAGADQEMTAAAGAAVALADWGALGTDTGVVENVFIFAVNAVNEDRVVVEVSTRQSQVAGGAG